jgi:hypothetical protein
MSTDTPERVSRHQLRTMEATLLAELLEEIRFDRAQNTRELARLRSGIVNDVLSCGLVTLDANGQYTESFLTPFGCLAIANHDDTTDLIVAGAPAAVGPPTKGKGVVLIPKGVFAVVNMSATEYTIYGLAGKQATVQVFTKGQPPIYAKAIKVSV